MDYTRLVEDQYFNFADEDMYRARVELENISEDFSKEEWRKKITEIAQEYCYSARYFLIRFLMERSDDVPSMEEVQLLTENELESYEERLMLIARGRQNFNEKKALSLIRKAMLDSRTGMKKKEQFLTREEAFALGHILGFSLEQMKSFLLRVLENDDGFSMKKADDLIEAYGFLRNLSLEGVKELKRAYLEMTDDIDKVENSDYDKNFTKELEFSIIAKTNEWSNLNSELADQKFLLWLEEKSPYLDSVSRTALCIYRNLTAYAYDLVTSRKFLPSEEELLDNVKEVVNQPGETEAVKQYFYDENERIATRECKKKIGLLSDFDSWKLVAAGNDGRPKSNTCVDRMLAMVTGEQSPQKADMLYLLWFIECLSWDLNKEHTEEDLFNRIADLVDLADETLHLAGLPEFYPPHLLEQSMLLSIINSKNQNPVDIYDLICESLVIKKNKTTGARKHSKEEKQKAVLEFIENPKDIKTICEKYEVSNKSLYAWKAKYIKTGKI